MTDDLSVRPGTAPRWFAWLTSQDIVLVLAWLVLAVVLCWAVAPDIFTSYSPTKGVPGGQLKAPNGEHWLGTDEVGRDVLARIIHGARQSLLGAGIAVTVGFLAGALLGLLAGAIGGVIDDIIMRIIDVLLAIPGLLISLSLIIVLGFGAVNVAIAVGAASVAAFARLTRSEVIRVRNSDYVEAAFGSGARLPSVMFTHILPNSSKTVLSYAALQFGAAILSVSTLGFLGYGAPPPQPEWGLMIAEGRNYMMRAWWLTFFPGLTVVLVVLAANKISRHFSRQY